MSGCGFKSHSRPLSIATSKNPTVVNIICISSSATLMWLPQETFNSNKYGNWRRQKRKWNVTLSKEWNGSSCTKSTLSASSTYGLIAQSVRAPERNSVVAGSNPTQANFLQLPQKFLQWWMSYVSAHPLHSCDYLKNLSIQINVATDEGNSWNEMWHRANNLF